MGVRGLGVFLCGGMGGGALETLAYHQADYRMDGKEELICCSVDGEVKGYLPEALQTAAKPADVAMDNEKLKELNQRKQVCGCHMFHRKHKYMR